MPELEVAAALLYYIYLALGSVSVGYFLVRFAYPEVRVFSPEEKLGASALVGLFIASVAVGADALVSGVPVVLNAKGSVLVFWLAASVGLFGVLKISLREKHAEVGVPVSSKLKVIQHELNELEENPPAKQSEISKKLNELRKKGLIPRVETSEEIVKAITPEPPKPTPPKPEVKPSEDLVKVQQNVHEAKRVLEKAKETEIEAILTDLNIKAERPLHRPPRKEQAKGLVEEPQETMETKQEPPTHQRRLYLQKTTAPKEEKKPEKKEKEKKEEEKKEAPAPLTMEDLFGATAGKQVSMVSSAHAPENCPTCQAKNSRIVFCPYCGTGMCANCSPTITPALEGFTYQCPKCGEDVLVKKRAQTSG